jgi:hypothetical protein
LVAGQRVPPLQGGVQRLFAQGADTRGCIFHPPTVGRPARSLWLRRTGLSGLFDPDPDSGRLHRRVRHVPQTLRWIVNVKSLRS